VVALVVVGGLVAAFLVLGSIGGQAQQQGAEDRWAATTFTLPATLDGLARSDDEQTKALSDGMSQVARVFPGISFTGAAGGYGGRLQVATLKASRALTKAEQDGMLSGEKRAFEDKGGGAVEPDPGPLGGAVVCAKDQPVCVVVDDAGMMAVAAPGETDVASTIIGIRGQIEHRG
jgi:hypothetical protein